MPRYTRPEHVQQFFQLNDILVEDKPSFYWRAIAPALDLGFRVLDLPAQGRDMVIITPLRHFKVYRGFKRTKHHLGMVLMHAMLSNPLH